MKLYFKDCNFNGKNTDGTDIFEYEGAHIKSIRMIGFTCSSSDLTGAAAAREAALREELATAKRNEHNSEAAYKAAIERQEELRALLAAPDLCNTHTGDSCRYCGGSGTQHQGEPVAVMVSGREGEPCTWFSRPPDGTLLYTSQPAPVAVAVVQRTSGPGYGLEGVVLAAAMINGTIKEGDKLCVITEPVPATRVVDREFKYATTGDDGTLRTVGGCIQRLQDRRLDP